MEKPLEVNFVSELDCDSICKVLTFVCSAHISSMNGARGCTFAHGFWIALQSIEDSGFDKCEIIVLKTVKLEFHQLRLPESS